MYVGVCGSETLGTLLLGELERDRVKSLARDLLWEVFYPHAYRTVLMLYSQSRCSYQQQ